MTNLQKNLIKASVIIGGCLIAQDVMAMTDGALKEAWDGSRLEGLIKGDIKRITGILAVCGAGIATMIPKAPKLETIIGTGAAILFTGLGLDWVSKSYAAMI
jgi:hypothetical protein